MTANGKFLGILAIACSSWLSAVASTSEKHQFKVDASAEGCTGLFWRTWDEEGKRFAVARDQQSLPWPRNGEIVAGRLDPDHPGWLLLEGGRALPFHDEAGLYTYLHALEAVAQGFLPDAPADAAVLFDVLIVGSGPAGLTAAIYAGRSARSAAVVGGSAPGGAMMLAQRVENFPAAKSERGSETMTRLAEQAKEFGSKFRAGTVVRVDLPSGWSEVKGEFQLQLVGGERLRGRSLIVATGARERWLDLSGEEELRGKHLHSCAYCDARFYEGRDVCVVGGGDGALEAAQQLARVARQVTLIHRRKQWRGSRLTAQKVTSLPNVKVLSPYVVRAWLTDSAGSSGQEQSQLQGARLQHTESGAEEDATCSGAFIAIGRIPQTSFVPAEVDRDSSGFLAPSSHSMTSVPGVFAAGQVADGRYQQAVTAAAAGAQAAMDANRWLDGELDAPVPLEGVALRSSDTKFLSPQAAPVRVQAGTRDFVTGPDGAVPLVLAGLSFATAGLVVGMRCGPRSAPCSQDSVKAS